MQQHLGYKLSVAPEATSEGLNFKHKTPHLKQPAQKLDRSYIARMTAIEDLTTGKVKVLYVSTHTSHEPCTKEVECLNFAESSITVGRYI